MENTDYITACIEYAKRNTKKRVKFAQKRGKKRLLTVEPIFHTFAAEKCNKENKT